MNEVNFLFGKPLGKNAGQKEQLSQITNYSLHLLEGTFSSNFGNVVPCMC